MTVINQHEVVGKDEDDESGKKLPRFCCPVLALSCLAYPVYPVYHGFKVGCQGPLAASQGSGVTLWSPLGHHRAALVAASGRLPAPQVPQWPPPGSCCMLDGASCILFPATN